MKSTTYARLTLLVPYLVLTKPVFDFITIYYYSNVDSLGAKINFWLLFSAAFWLTPYTILAISLLVWSKGKSIEQIRMAYIASPNCLAVILPIVFIIAWIIYFIATGEKDSSIGFGIILAIAMFFSIPASILIGYLFVGISLLFYKFLIKINFIRD